MSQRTDSVVSAIEYGMMAGFVALIFAVMFPGIMESFSRFTEKSRIDTEYNVCVSEAGTNRDFLEMCQEEKDKKLKKLEAKTK